MTQLSDYTVPTTALQAVNLILEAIGQSPVASLTNPGTDANTAVKRLGESSVETQAEGWAWNTDEDYVLDPGTDGTISLPAGTMRIVQTKGHFPIAVAAGSPPPGGVLPTGPALVMVSGAPQGRRFVIRGGQLYDRVGKTFNIGVSVKLNLTVALEYEDIPQAARWYIALKAARRMTAGALVSGTAYQFTKADEDQARVRMEQEEDDYEALDNLEATNSHIQFMTQR